MWLVYHVLRFYSYICFTGANAVFVQENLSAQFCKSPKVNLQKYEEEIWLTNMNKVNHGYILMPKSYVNQSITRYCEVTFSGSANGIIIFHHQRLSNSTSALCLKDRRINDTMYEGPCSEQSVYFSKVTKVALAVRKLIQDDFILHFTGVEQRVKKLRHYSLLFSPSDLLHIIVCLVGWVLQLGMSAKKQSHTSVAVSYGLTWSAKLKLKPQNQY